MSSATDGAHSHARGALTRVCPPWFSRQARETCPRCKQRGPSEGHREGHRYEPMHLVRVCCTDIPSSAAGCRLPPFRQDKENNLKPGGALKQWMEQQRAYSTETARGSQLEASAAPAAAPAAAEPRAQHQAAPDFRELYADLPLLNDAAATIQRHVRGLRDRRRTREYCRAIMDDADAADALYMERGALPGACIVLGTWIPGQGVRRRAAPTFQV